MPSARDTRFSSNVKLLMLCTAAAWVALIPICCLLVLFGYGPYLELFNGATWPGRFDSAAAHPLGTLVVHLPRDLWFFAILAARTLINLGFVLAAVPAVVGAYWLATGGLEMLLAKQLAAVQKARDLAVAAEIIRALVKSGFQLEEKEEDLILKTGQGFAESAMGKHMASLERQHIDRAQHLAEEAQKAASERAPGRSRTPYP